MKVNFIVLFDMLAIPPKQTILRQHTSEPQDGKSK